jgi:hypothetical protein
MCRAVLSVSANSNFALAEKTSNAILLSIWENILEFALRQKAQIYLVSCQQNDLSIHAC